MAEYVVYMDLADHREHKVHLATCSSYLRHLDLAKAGTVTATTRWYGPFASEREANLKTHVTRICNYCIALNVEESDQQSRDVVVTDINIPFTRILEIVFQWGFAISIWYLVISVIGYP